MWPDNNYVNNYEIVVRRFRTLSHIHGSIGVSTVKVRAMAEGDRWLS